MLLSRNPNEAKHVNEGVRTLSKTGEAVAPRVHHFRLNAGMAKQVNASALGADSERIVGSSPTAGTRIPRLLEKEYSFGLNPKAQFWD